MESGECAVVILREAEVPDAAHMHEYFVYMLRCADDSLYIGVTNDYVRRLAEHNYGIDPRHYTWKRRPVTLVHVEVFGDVTEAIRREKQLKRWSRKKKEALVAGDEELLSKYAKKIFQY
jgi:putative endonuclease